MGVGIGLGIDIPSIFGGSSPGGGVASFIIYEITNSGTAFVLRSTGTVDYTVDWGDGSTDTITSRTDPALTHVYSSSGTYRLTLAVI